MTNTLALWLAAVIAAVFAVDALWLGGTLPLVLLRGITELVQIVAFWR